jgi:hypothetical protein
MNTQSLSSTQVRYRPIPDRAFVVVYGLVATSGFFMGLLMGFILWN